MTYLSLAKVSSFVSASLLLLSCTGTGTPQSLPPSGPASTLPSGTPTPLAPMTTPRPFLASGPGPTPVGRAEMTTIKVKFDTYETEETVGDELSKVRGVLAIVVTQTEITVTYDPQVTSLAAIMKVLAENPEVRLEEHEER